MSLLPDLSRRAEIPEMMDSAENLTPGDLRATLDFLARANRSFGGYRIVLGTLERWLRARPARGPLTLLDAGTGGGDLPAAVCDWARRRGVALTAVGLDSDPAVARHARRRLEGRMDVRVERGSIEEAAAEGRRFDFVTASMVLHHVPDDKLVSTLRALDRMARRGLIVVDLERSRLGYAGVWALTGLLGNRVAHHDGPVSVRRAFTASELDALAARAGLPHLRARRHAGVRLSLSGEKTGV